MVLRIQTKGHTDIIDITDKIQEVVKKEKIIDGAVTVFVKGSKRLLA